MDDAIESILDEPLEDMPETIEVCGYIPMVPNKTKIAKHVVEHLVEHLEDEFGNPDGDYVETTDNIKKAAEDLVRTVLEEFTVWACDLVKWKTINVQEWIKENRPEWLEETR